LLLSPDTSTGRAPSLSSSTGLKTSVAGDVDEERDLREAEVALELASLSAGREKSILSLPKRLPRAVSGS
jgi:hypothetical protein